MRRDISSWPKFSLTLMVAMSVSQTAGILVSNSSAGGCQSRDAVLSTGWERSRGEIDVDPLVAHALDHLAYGPLDSLLEREDSVDAVCLK